MADTELDYARECAEAELGATDEGFVKWLDLDAGIDPNLTTEHLEAFKEAFWEPYLEVLEVSRRAMTEINRR